MDTKQKASGLTRRIEWDGPHLYVSCDGCNTDAQCEECKEAERKELSTRCCFRCKTPEAQVDQLYHDCDANPYRSKDCVDPECDSFTCSNCNEADYESYLSDYYGGSSPCTLDEMCAVALEMKRGLR